MTKSASDELLENMRPRLFGLAYRMLGLVEDAEDAVQETLIRWFQADQSEVSSPEGWLMTVCSRHCIDKLRASKSQREHYVGPWLPEPLVSEELERSPEELTELSEDLSMALLVVLESLSPVERAAYLLHEIFDYSYTEVGAILGKSETACRQVLARARKRVQAGKPRFDVSEAERLETMRAFYQAVETGNVEIVESYLTESAEMWSDGGGKAIAAMNVVYGANNIARFFCGIYKKGTHPRLVPCRINGEIGVLMYDGDTLEGVIAMSFSGVNMDKIFVVRNPDKLQGVAG